ncbi:unnamed protein product [Rhizophagus irregularis]|nr:unnamed protein product [Rhizophagus irregularis]
MSSETSTPYTPASTSTTVAGNETTKKDLKEVLAKHGVQDGRITDIPQFTPKPHNIDDKNEALIRSECYTMRKCFTN